MFIRTSTNLQATPSRAPGDQSRRLLRRTGGLNAYRILWRWRGRSGPPCGYCCVRRPTIPALGSMWTICTRFLLNAPSIACTKQWANHAYARRSGHAGADGVELPVGRLFQLAGRRRPGEGKRVSPLAYSQCAGDDATPVERGKSFNVMGERTLVAAHVADVLRKGDRKWEVRRSSMRKLAMKLARS